MNINHPRVLTLHDLEKLHQIIHVCTVCELAETRTTAVPGDGTANANVMFIGEAPGYNEDRQGIPFVGAAGNFLNELLDSIGLNRKDVFITNMVKCRPPNNRDPFPNELTACASYLDAQIEFINPDVIVPLGRHALGKWFPGKTIGKVHAQPEQIGKLLIFPLYHPAAALHNGGLRTTIMQDFKKLGALLKQIRPQKPAMTKTSDDGESVPKRLDMS
jgi:DNA polymerase